MNRGVLGEDFRALAVAAEPETEAAQQAVISVHRPGIVAAHRKARQHAARFGEAPGFRDFVRLIRGGIGAPNAPAPDKASARSWWMIGERVQGIDDRCGSGVVVWELAQNRTLGWNVAANGWHGAGERLV